MADCIFCKIIGGEIPSTKFYEDDDMILIQDIKPEARMHMLLIPKEHFANIVEMTEEQSKLLARCLKKLGEIADSLGLKNGFRLINNKGADSGQTVDHLHIHILGGEALPVQLV